MTQFEPSKSEQRSSFGAAHNVITDLENNKISVDVACNRLILLAEQVNWKQLQQWLQQQEVSSRLSHNNYRAIIDMLTPVINNEETFTDPFIKKTPPKETDYQAPPAYHDEPPVYNEQTNQDDDEYQPLSEEEMQSIPIEAPRQDASPPKEPSMFLTVFGGITLIGGIVGLTVYLGYDKIEAMLNKNAGSAQQTVQQTLEPSTPQAPTEKFNLDLGLKDIPFLDKLKNIPYISDLPFFKELSSKQESVDTLQLPIQQTDTTTESMPLTRVVETKNDQQPPAPVQRRVVLQKTPEQLAQRIEEALEKGLTTTNAKAVGELLYALIDIDKNAVKTKMLRDHVASHLLKQAQAARDEDKFANANFFVELALSVNQYGKQTY